MATMKPTEGFTNAQKVLMKVRERLLLHPEEWYRGSPGLGPNGQQCLGYMVQTAMMNGRLYDSNVGKSVISRITVAIRNRYGARGPVDLLRFNDYIATSAQDVADVVGEAIDLVVDEEVG